MKTKQELENIKEEIEKLSTELHELTDEELEQVTGGITAKPHEVESGLGGGLEAKAEFKPIDMPEIALEGVAGFMP